MASNTELNRDHWNEASKTYNTQFSSTIQQIIGEIQARKSWIGVDWVSDGEDSDSSITSPNPSSSISKKAKEPSACQKRTIRLLDYACGTGLVSRALAASVTQCIGIDLTEGMVSVYNASASNQGIPSSEMHAVVGNLIDPSSAPPAHLSGPEFHDFDIAVVGLGFHHFDDPALAAKRLAERLKIGGVLMIVDFMPHGNHSHAHTHSPSHSHTHDQEKTNAQGGEEKPHQATHTVTHHGFSEPEVKHIFEAAGVGKAFDYVVVGTGIVFKPKGENGAEMKRSLFMAKGVKS